MMQEHPGGSADVNGEAQNADPEKTPANNKALQKKLIAREMITEVKEI